MNTPDLLHPLDYTFLLALLLFPLLLAFIVRLTTDYKVVTQLLYTKPFSERVDADPPKLFFKSLC
jgi:hypothetical protein